MIIILLLVSYGWKSKDNNGGILWQRKENSSALFSFGGNISMEEILVVNLYLGLSVFKYIKLQFK